MVVLVPPLQVDVAVVAAPPPAARGPRCSRRRTARGRARAPRRDRDGRSPWPHRHPRAAERRRMVFQIVQRCPWRRPAPGCDGWDHEPDDDEGVGHGVRRRGVRRRTCARSCRRRAARSTRPSGSSGWCRARPPRRTWSAGPASTTGASRTTPAGSCRCGSTRMPYEMTDARDREHRRGGARHEVEVGQEPPVLAVRVHPGPRRARRGHHRGHAQRRRRGQRELPRTTWPTSGRGTRSSSAASSASRTRSPTPTPGSSRASSSTTPTSSSPTTTRFHTIHIYVDEEHGGHVGEFAERYLDTDEKRRSARAAYLGRGRADPPLLGRLRRRHLVSRPASHADRVPPAATRPCARPWP